MTPEQMRRTNTYLMELDDVYEDLDKLHKLYKEGKRDTPLYKELEEKLEKYFKKIREPEEHRKKNKSTIPKRCKK